MVLVPDNLGGATLKAKVGPLPEHIGQWKRQLFVVSNSAQRDYAVEGRVVANSDTVDVNGLVVVNDPNWDYTVINNNTIRFSNAVVLKPGWRIQVKYQSTT